MKSLSRGLLVLVLLVVLLALPLVALAQDAPPDAPTPPGTALDLLLNTLANLVYVPVAAPLVVILTSISKRLIQWGDAALHALVWSVLVWAVWAVASNVGYEAQYNDVVSALIILLPTIAGFFATSVTVPRLYDQARSQGVAIIGYRRPEGGIVDRHADTAAAFKPPF